MKGVFITFEGSEGCGKSTQAKMLYEYLRGLGRKVVFIREPGGSAIGEKIRAILLDKKNDGMSASCELLLYMAARAQVVAEVIKPLLDKGTIVICDRFLDSTVAYQGYGLGVDIKVIKRIGAYATQGVTPDLTILLEVALKKGLAHRAGIQDRIEQRPLRYHRAVRKGYQTMAAREPRRITIIKVASEKSITQRAIRAAVKRAI
jgi:dTMP kinase